MTTLDDEWMESSDIFSFFPTLVWKIQLKPERQEDINAKLRAVLQRARDGSPDLVSGEAWQSTHELHQLTELSGLASCIERAVRGVIGFLKLGCDEFEITGCWASISAKGAAHRAHSHPNNFLSGVYYLQTGPGADTINFHDPRSQTAIIRPPVTELTRDNTDQVVVTVSDGTLLLFPSYLEFGA